MQVMMKPLQHRKEDKVFNKNLSREDIDNFLKKWNEKFPYDRLWRKKYKISFGSIEHLSVSQIDIFLDIAEDFLVDKLRKNYSEFINRKEEYEKTGEILKENTLTQEEEDQIWKKIKLPVKDV